MITTRGAYSIIMTVSAIGLIWLVAGVPGVLAFSVGIAYGQIDLGWIPDEPGDLD